MRNWLRISTQYSFNKKIKIGYLLYFLNKHYYFIKKNCDKSALSPISSDKIDIINDCSGGDYISIVSVAKNEAPYIKEWIEYHKLIGVNRFYFYDNESTDNTKEILKPYIESGLVIYHYVRGNCMQMPVYEDAISRYKNNTRWMAIIDLDEYIVPVEKDNIKDFLKDYEKYPAVVMNWLFFDSNGHKEKPEGLIIDSYTRIPAKGADKTIKSIFNPKSVSAVFHPHYCAYNTKEKAVTENFDKMPSCYPFVKKPSINKIKLNHYFTKSYSEYKNKIEKGYADQKTKRPFLEDKLNFKNYTFDTTILKYSEELQKIINGGEI